MSQPILTLTVALLGGLIPTACYVLCFWWLDRYEKEPVWLLGLAFLWGMVPAAFLSALFEVLADLPLAALGGGGLAANLISVSVSAPVIEESFKSLALIGLVLLFRHEFDNVLDGIIYGAMIGFGFALTENVAGYFLPILSEEGLQAGLLNILLRSAVFGFNHALWTGVTGAAFGYARLEQDRGQRLLVPLGGWTLSVTLHAIHNAGAILAQQTACLTLGVSLVVDWGGVLALLTVAGMTLRRESRWIEAGLADEVRSGRLTAAEFDLLRSAGRRFRARWESRRQGGRAAYRAVGRYFQCATELAFRQHHLRTLGDEGGHRESIEQLREQLVACRAEAGPWLSLF